MRPIQASGNSDSDMQMIEYTRASTGRRLGLFVHHTDADHWVSCVLDNFATVVDAVEAIRSKVCFVNQRTNKCNQD